MENKDIPAYPQPVGRNPGAENRDITGLTKRELIAAMAMQGILSMHGLYEPSKLAKDAIQTTDALMAELEKTKP